MLLFLLPGFLCYTEHQKGRVWEGRSEELGSSEGMERLAPKASSLWSQVKMEILTPVCPESVSLALLYQLTCFHFPR